MNATPTHWLQRLQVHSLSLVDRGANKRRFHIYKAQDGSAESKTSTKVSENTGDTVPILPPQEQKSLEPKPCESPQSVGLQPTVTTESEQSKKSQCVESEEVQPSELYEALNSSLERQNARLTHISEQLLHLQARITQLSKSAGLSNGEHAQAQAEAHAAKKRCNHAESWDAVTDGFGYLRPEALKQHNQGD